MCAEHNVRTRRELAARLGVPPAQLVRKREVVYAALAAGKTVSQIIRETGFAKGTVCKCAWKFRQERLSGAVGGGESRPTSRRQASVPAASMPPGAESAMRRGRRTCN